MKAASVSPSASVPVLLFLCLSLSRHHGSLSVLSLLIMPGQWPCSLLSPWVCDSEILHTAIWRLKMSKKRDSALTFNLQSLWSYQTRKSGPSDCSDFSTDVKLGPFASLMLLDSSKKLCLLLETPSFHTWESRTAASLSLHVHCIAAKEMHVLCICSFLWRPYYENIQNCYNA